MIFPADFTEVFDSVLQNILRQKHVANYMNDWQIVSSASHNTVL